MFKYKLQFMKHGFTIIELIVIMAVMAILVFLGSLGYKGYTKQAQLTRLQVDARLLSDACQRYYVNNGDYPRLVDTPYTADQVNAFASKVYDQKGAVIALDSSGNYYDLDFSKLKKYLSVNEDYKNFILQNPVGDIYFLEPSQNIRLPENAGLKPAAPTLVVDATKNPPTYNVTYPSGVTPQETDYQLDGGDVVTSVPVDLLVAGNHNIKVRYKYNNNYSDWTSEDFVITNGVVQLALGVNHSVALMQDGTVKAWGYNRYGQLGISTNSGTENPCTIPTTIPGLINVKQISAGEEHTVALMKDGTVKAWGYNAEGELGTKTNNGTYNPNVTPTTIPGLIDVNQISAGGFHTVALMQDGSVKSWGYNGYGQLGISANSGNGNPNPTPTTLSGLSGIKQIVAAGGNTYALLQDGTVKAWGMNNYGQLGTTVNNGTTNPNPTPTSVPGLVGVKDIEACGYHVIAIMEDGSIKAWGYNRYGQLGLTINSGTSNVNPTPTTIPGLTGVERVSVGFYHTTALMQDGTVKSWGSNVYGQLGIDTNSGTGNPNATPTTIPGLSGVRQIAAGYYHTIAVMQDGSIKAWGRNYKGVLGNTTNIGTNIPNPTPVTVSGL